MTTWDPSNKDSNITLSSANLTASSSAAGWRSAIATGSGKTSGKWYWQVKWSTAGTFSTGCICTKTEPTNNYIGATDANGWIAYIGNNSPSGSVQNNGTVLTQGILAPGANAFSDGDSIVVCLDADNGFIWFTTMNNSVGLETRWNWNAVTGGNPATATQGIPVSLLATGALLPAVSLVDTGAVATLDTTTIISDPTLSGFLPFDAVILHLAALPEGTVHNPLNVTVISAPGSPPSARPDGTSHNPLYVVTMAAPGSPPSALPDGTSYNPIHIVEVAIPGVPPSAPPDGTSYNPLYVATVSAPGFTPPALPDGTSYNPLYVTTG